MSNFIYRCTLLVATICCLVGATSTNAQTNYYWNGGSIATTPAAGGSGTWSTSNAWRTISTTGSQATWANANNAILAGTAGTVALSADVTAATITVNTSDYSLSTASTTTRSITGPFSLADNVLLKFAPCPSCNSATASSNGGTINIGGNISTTTGGSLQILGNTTSTNPSSYTRLNIGSANNQTINISVNTEILGGKSDGFAGYAMSGSITGVTGNLNGSILNNSVNTTFLGSNTTTGILNISGIVSGSANVQFAAGVSGGSGTINLNTAATYTGITYFNSTSAIVKMGLTNALPTTTQVVLGRTQNTGTWDLNGYNQEVASISSGGANYTSIITNNGTSDAALTISGSNTPIIACNAAIKDGTTNKLGLVRSGTGTTELITASTYTGATTVSGGTLKLNKTGGSTILTTNNITISGGILQISTNQTLNNLTITSGTLIVDAGATLTITGTLINAGAITNNGNIIVQSSSISSGAFINNSGSTVPNVTLQQWVTGQRGYRVLSNPFSTALTPSAVGTANGITITGANDVKTYNSDNTWTNNISSISGGTPYSVFIRGLASEVTGLAYTAGPTAFAYGVTGTLNGSSVILSQDNTATGWTLAGNPFAAPITSSALTGRVSGKSYYLYDVTVNSPSDKQKKSGGWIPVALSSDAKTIPMMGVVAYQAGTGAGTTFTVTSADINTASTSVSTNLFGESEAVKLLEFALSKAGSYQDKLYVRSDATASDASNENMDLLKLSNDVTNIYTVAPDKAHLAIDARKGIDASIPVGITAPVGTYTFTVASNNLPNAANVYLLDKLTNTKTVLTPGATYSFDITTEAATKGEDRFELGAVKTAVVDVITNDAFSVKVLGNAVNNAVTVQVKGAKAAVTITVTDIQGKIISNTTSNNVMNTVRLAGGSGMYFIKVTDGDNSIINKVVKP